MTFVAQAGDGPKALAIEQAALSQVLPE